VIAGFLSPASILIMVALVVVVALAAVFFRR